MSRRSALRPRSDAGSLGIAERSLGRWVQLDVSAMNRPVGLEPEFRGAWATMAAQEVIATFE